MKLVPLRNGGFAKVSDQDFKRVSRYEWRVNVLGYVHRWKDPRCYLHRFIVGARKELVVDHRFGDKLDNRRSKLRETLQRLNSANRGLTKGRNVKGVGWHAGAQKWRARLMIKRREIHLGLFNRQIDAVRAYDSAAVFHFGEFALTNAMIRKVA